MSELYFSYGRGESFTSMKLANKKNGYSNPIRELMQNSLDASREAENDKCVIDIYIEKIKRKDIPNIDDYEEALENSIKLLKSRGGYTSGNKQMVGSIKKELRKDDIDVLMFVDNGTGMNQVKLENLLDEISNHADENAGGSYGVGHLSSYFLSSLRYVLYATKYNKNNKIENLFTGSSILAGHENKRTLRGSKGRIIAETPVNEANPKFKYLEIFPKFIQLKMDELKSTGSMVAILGLNEKWGDDAEYAIASNFFHAIFCGRLKVNVHRNNKLTEINNEKLKNLLYLRKNNGNAKDTILSGQDFYQAYQTIQNTKNIVKLRNEDKIYIYSANKIDSSPCICLIRNGMLIARHDNMLSTHINNLRKNEDFESFMVVIDVDKIDAKNLFRLVRNAENTEHNKLINKKEAPLGDKKNIKELFQELSEKIKNFLDKRDRESFDLPFFEMPDKAKTKGNAPKTSGQNEKAKIKIRPSVRPPKVCEICNERPCICDCSKCGENPCICETPPKAKGSPEINLPQLESNNAMRYIDKGSNFEIRIRVKPAKQFDGKDYVYFSIAISEDNDSNARGHFLEFICLSVNNKKVAKENFVRDNKQIELGRLNNETDYNIVAKVKKPSGFNNTKVALEPIFGLKNK